MVKYPFLLALLAAAPAWAQTIEPAIPARLFTPSANPHDLVVERALPLEHLNFAATFTLDMGHRLLYLEREGVEPWEILGGRVSSHLLLALGLWERLELRLTLPFTVYQYGDGVNLSDPLDPFGFMDIEVSAKVFLGAWGPFRLALLPWMTIPVGQETQFLGKGYPTAAGLVVGELTLPYNLSLALNGGYLFQKKVQAAATVIDDELLFRLGLRWQPLRELAIYGEIYGSTPASSDFATQSLTPVEAVAGLRYWPVPFLYMTVGGGTGVVRGMGAPQVRAFLGVGWSPAEWDTDGDGIGDGQDACPDHPEDRDGFEDEDGCPDLDNDNDKIPDKEDRCPNEAEDLDGFEDGDGCPDSDNDQDGLPDDEDQCPYEAGPPERQGCP